jgi:hypothetical protein
MDRLDADEPGFEILLGEFIKAGPGPGLRPPARPWPPALSTIVGRMR